MDASKWYINFKLAKLSRTSALLNSFPRTLWRLDSGKLGKHVSYVLVHVCGPENCQKSRCVLSRLCTSTPKYIGTWSARRRRTDNIVAGRLWTANLNSCLYCFLPDWVTVWVSSAAAERTECVCVLTRIICGHKCALANNPLHFAGARYSLPVSGLGRRRAERNDTDAYECAEVKV